MTAQSFEGETLMQGLHYLSLSLFALSHVIFTSLHGWVCRGRSTRKGQLWGEGCTPGLLGSNTAILTAGLSDALRFFIEVLE